MNLGFQERNHIPVQVKNRCKIRVHYFDPVLLKIDEVTPYFLVICIIIFNREYPSGVSFCYQDEENKHNSLNSFHDWFLLVWSIKITNNF